MLIIETSIYCCCFDLTLSVCLWFLKKGAVLEQEFPFASCRLQACKLFPFDLQGFFTFWLTTAATPAVAAILSAVKLNF